ncbi:translation initiation factor [Moniliophthora roreri]|uniref:RRM domain-containing protein n=1 Tax=Moniliophthora roreri TaxID=221103 RepID=A0A0W0FCK8_MONRR|nr:translation initiation factor [Moniliophthora roreri]
MQHSNDISTPSGSGRVLGTSARREVHSCRPRSGAEKAQDVKHAHRVAEKKREVRVNPIVYVGNLPMNTTEKHVKDLFATCGKVHRVTIANSSAYTKKPIEPTLYAYVEFRNPSARERAAKYHGHTILGKRITVSYHPGRLPDVDKTVQSCIDASSCEDIPKRLVDREPTVPLM